MAEELTHFVKEALGQGKSREEIHSVLLVAGWEEEEVKKALASFADVPFSVAVPRKKPYLQAREAFLYLVSFISLYIVAFSFGVLVFHFIDFWFPDSLERMYGDPTRSALRMAVSSLVIAFPLYLFMMRTIRRGAAKDPERRESKVRKWLTYLTLVVAASIIIGDLITVVFNLLGGELTIRFAFKALTVLVITGSIFGYYLTDLQKEEKEQ
ncbi:hypothetical protein KKI17_02310 [Patescibacteria group bacterium]|nr:hypothetical protein [Patescibacteria group bacterium]